MIPTSVPLWLVMANIVLAVPTIYLVGDSTMAEGGGGSATQGWGHFLQYSFDTSVAVVSNHAKAGSSYRSYTREGRLDSVLGLVQSGDWVVCEMGHNDGGSLNQADNGRTECAGDGNQTCLTFFNGVNETVLTFPAYIKLAATQILAKGANVIVSSATPNNIWEDGSGNWSPDRFFGYDWLAVSELGGPSEGVYFVPHGVYAAQAMQNLGNETVNANYPNDHTHTGPFLADAMSQAFVLGLKCGTSPLKDLVLNSTYSLTSTFLGSCVDESNSTWADLLR